MTCADLEQHLDRFLDTELPPPMLLEIARHAAACPSCEETVRQMTSLHDAVARVAREEAAGLDLSGIWPGVATRIERMSARRAWARRLRSAPVWAATLAAAASLALWVRAPEPPAQIASAPRVVRAATRMSPNMAYIDRLAGKGLSVRREPKAGTTIIWVNYNTPGGAAR
jgi:anti-sigma factor RsiW